jgi:hypothetical protein
MAKARKTRKAAKRPAKTRKGAVKAKTRAKAARAKTRRPAKRKTRKAKARKQTSFIDTMTDTVLETGALRQRLAGHNTFED